jgi:selenocysteine-specific elongation factor
VNLAGISHAEIWRGMTLGAPGIFVPTDRLDVRVDLLPSAPPLKNRARVHFHQGTAQTVAEVILMEGDELAPGGSAFAQLRLKQKIFLLPGDRFILRQFSPVVTIGGGVAIDIRTPRHWQRDTSVAARLRTLERGSREEQLGALLDATTRSLGIADVIARTGWVEPEITATAKTLAEKRRLRIIADQPLMLASVEAMAICTSALRDVVDAFHRENPLLPGIPKQDLRGRAGNPSQELFEASLGDLLRAGTVGVSGDVILRAGRAIALAPEEVLAKESIEREFERAGLTVPNFAAVLAKLPVESGRAQKILQILVREKVLIKVAEDLVFHRAAVARLRDLLVQYRKERGERLPIPAFKELTGVTRKYAIPLLEYLDREHVTRRVGDERVII